MLLPLRQGAPARRAVKPATWPTGVRVSFGKMFAAKLEGDATMAQQIDAVIEDDYRTNL